MWKFNLAALNAKRGEALVARANELVNKPEPPQNESSRIIGSALDRYHSAEQVYVSLLTASHPSYSQLFNVRIKIADILVRQAKFDEALQVYQSAAGLVQTASATRPVVDWQLSLAKAIEEAGDGLQLQLADATKPAATALSYYQNALELIEAALAGAPDDLRLQPRKDALNAKIEALRAAAK
jgi:tetratricopeptide (TPR) repeat protein